GAFVLDISAIKANADFSFSYSSTDATGKVLDSSTGTIKRSVNIVDVFSGGSVTANPNNTTNSVANTMSKVAVDIFNDYKLPITLVGQKVQKIISRTQQVIKGAGDKLTFQYEEGMLVDRIQFALPSQLRSFGEGNFEVELSIDGQVYKSTVNPSTNSVTFALDKNIDKFLGGKNYNIKIYKRVSPTVTELVMNSINKIPDKQALTYVTYTDSRNRPPIFYSNAGDILDFGMQVVEHQGSLVSYNHLMINSVPSGTSRVEVKYKLQGASQWSTLTSSAALYKNSSGWYQANLSALNTNTIYDYQYITYNAKGDVLGGGQGVINTANNQASVTQKVLSANDMPNIYKDKKEIVNSKQDLNNVIYKDIGVFNATFLKTKGYLKDDDTAYFGIEYTFNNSILREYGKDEFAIVVKNRNTGELIKTTNMFYLSAGDITKINVDIYAAEFKKTVFINNTANYQVTLVYKDGQSFIPIASCDNDVRREKNGSYYDYDLMYNYSHNQGSGSLTKDLLFRLTNQPVNTTHMFIYYRELGSKAPYICFPATPLKDIYGNPVAGSFDFNFQAPLDITKKYEIQYVTLSGETIVNRQQGIMEFNAAGMQVSVSPMNYGGDGFVLFHGGDGFSLFHGMTVLSFVDQFKPIASNSTVAQLKLRKVGSGVWENITLTGISGWFNWDFGSRNGEYEFKLDSYNKSGDTSPAGSIIGKLRLGAEPQVLSYIPTSFVQNHITFSGQPTGSKTLTVKYGTVAGQLNQTAVL
ncbi:hypothetical protein, partial [Acinetobacter sp. 3657]|uniref:hypothetical protein n=1 Tax=Acinetobacter sp. 3657 TaxID=2817764 RepID=UPI002861F87A|nr:uncharacterized protein YegP (UPF0339 family) [Prolinoborus sp. 3657]